MSDKSDDRRYDTKQVFESFRADGARHGRVTHEMFNLTKPQLVAIQVEQLELVLEKTKESAAPGGGF